jgi:hypothetical protein
VWVDNNREVLSDSYLPFSVLSVGIIPIQVSAFMYGLFVGKALEKHGLKIVPTTTKVAKDVIMKEIERNIDYYNGLFGEDLKDKNKELNDDSSEKETGK